MFRHPFFDGFFWYPLPQEKITTQDTRGVKKKCFQHNLRLKMMSYGEIPYGNWGLYPQKKTSPVRIFQKTTSFAYSPGPFGVVLGTFDPSLAETPKALWAPQFAVFLFLLSEGSVRRSPLARESRFVGRRFFWSEVLKEEPIRQDKAKKASFGLQVLLFCCFRQRPEGFRGLHRALFKKLGWFCLRSWDVEVFLTQSISNSEDNKKNGFHCFEF